jgi:hypothetical protein
MLNTRTFLLLLATFAIGGVVFGGLWADRGSDQSLPSFLDHGQVFRPQEARDRVWKQTPLERVYALGGDPDEAQPVVYGPLRVKADHRDHLYVLDLGDFFIKEFSPEGRLLHKYGNGRGQGPGELNSVTDFNVTPAGELWVSDSTNGRVVVFDSKARLLRMIKLDLQPYRMIPDPPGFNLMLPTGAPTLFGRFDGDGRQMEEFGVFLHNQARYSQALDGYVAPDGPGGFVYAGMFAGVLASYTRDGEPRFQVKTIDPRPLPRIDQDGESTWVDRTAEYSALSLSVSGAGVNVLTYMRSGVKRVGTIDTYDRRSGAYLYSRRVPGKCNWVYVTDDHVYAVHDATITKWKLPRD